MLVAYVPLYFQIENTLFPYNPIFQTKAVLFISTLGNTFQEPCHCKEPFDKAILLLGIYPKEILVYLQNNRCPRQFISALLTIHLEDQKHPKWHVHGQRTNSMKEHPYQKHYTATERKYSGGKGCWLSREWPCGNQVDTLRLAALGLCRCFPMPGVISYLCGSLNMVLSAQISLHQQSLPQQPWLKHTVGSLYII